MLEILDKYENAKKAYLEFETKVRPTIIGAEVQSLINFLDYHKFYIGIIPDSEGVDWLVEILGINVGICKNRAEAELLGIEEGLASLENLMCTI
jgi:hypothetical protein